MNQYTAAIIALTLTTTACILKHHTDTQMTECQRMGQEMAMNNTHHNHTAHLIACGMNKTAAENATMHDANMSSGSNMSGNMSSKGNMTMPQRR